MKARLQRIWKHMNSTAQRKVFFFSITLIILLVLINIPIGSEFIFILTIVIAVIAVIASAAQVIERRSLFTKEMGKMKAELAESRPDYMDTYEDFDDEDSEQELKRGPFRRKRKKVEPTPFSEKEQEFIRKRLSKYKVAMFVHVAFIILLAVLMIQILF